MGLILLVGISIGGDLPNLRTDPTVSTSLNWGPQTITHFTHKKTSFIHTSMQAIAADLALPSLVDRPLPPATPPAPPEPEEAAGAEPSWEKDQ